MDVLASFEADISAYRVARDKAGKALLAIHDGDLWADEYQSFEAYCEDRWGFKKANAYQLIDAGRLAIAAEEKSVITDSPPSQHQMRELKRIRLSANTYTDSSEWDVRATAWQHISDTLGTDAKPEEIRAFIAQEYSIPRPRRFELTPEDRMNRMDEQNRKMLNKALEQIATMPQPLKYYLKKFGEGLLPHWERAKKYLNE